MPNGNSGEIARVNGESDDYVSQYAYLDGHAEGKPYKDFAEYINQMHPPVRQKWWGTDFPTAFGSMYP
jgi:prepilin-type processing-associated H-X9-DG protein